MSEITKNLSSEQIQSFDIDSIKEMIDSYKEKKELFMNDFDIDDKSNLSIEEIKIFSELEKSENVLEWLKELLIAVEKETTMWSTVEKNIWNIWEDITDSIKEIKKEHITAIAEELMQEWNIPDNEAIISVLDKIQYIATWEEDERIWELIKKLKNWTEWDWNLRLEASQVIWLYTWLAWTSVYNQVQEEIIQWILWNNEWFNQEFLMWYESKKWWNFLISIKEFENDIKTKTIDKWNKEAWSNYIKYLTSIWKWDQKSLQEKFWDKKLNELSKYWEENPDAIGKKLIEKDIVEQINLWLKLWDKEETLINKGLKIWETMDNIIQFDKFFEEIINLSTISIKNIGKNPGFNSANGMEKAIEKMEKLEIKDVQEAKTYLSQNPDTAIKLAEKFTVCPNPEEEKNSLNIINTAREMQFNKKIDKLKLKGYRKWKETADIFLKNIIKWDFCAQKVINWLNEFTDSNWEGLEFEQLEKILWEYISIKEYQIKYELTQILSEENIEKVYQINNKEELQEFLEKNSNKKLNWEDLDKYVQLIEWLQKSKNYKDLWLEKSTFAILNTQNQEWLDQRLKNDINISKIETLLKQDKTKYLKVVNDLKIFNNIATDIRAISNNSTYVIKKLIDAEKKWLLDNDWKELLGILEWLNYIEKDNIKIKKEQYQFKIKEEQESKIINYEKFNNKENNYYSTKDKNYDNYSSNSWIIKITSDKSIQLNPLEKKLVNKNPDTLNNIVDFYKTLDKVWLSKFWKIKDRLFTSISNVKWIWFKIDKDYLNENETKIFLNSILKSIWEEEISPIFTLKSFLAKIEIKNKTQLWWWEAVVNTYYEETYIENKFYNKYINRNSWLISFNQAKFEKSLKK